MSTDISAMLRMRKGLLLCGWFIVMAAPCVELMSARRAADMQSVMTKYAVWVGMDAYGSRRDRRAVKFEYLFV